MAQGGARLAQGFAQGILRFRRIANKSICTNCAQGSRKVGARFAQAIVMIVGRGLCQEVFSHDFYKTQILQNTNFTKPRVAQGGARLAQGFAQATLASNAQAKALIESVMCVCVYVYENVYVYVCMCMCMRMSMCMSM